MSLLQKNIQGSEAWSCPMCTLTIEMANSQPIAFVVSKTQEVWIHVSNPAPSAFKSVQFVGTCCLSLFSIFSFGDSADRGLTGLRKTGNLLCGLIILFLVKYWWLSLIVFVRSADRSGIGLFNSTMSVSIRGCCSACGNFGGAYLNNEMTLRARHIQI